MRLWRGWLVGAVMAMGVVARTGRAQDSAQVDRILRLQKALDEKNRTLKLGVSLGWRHLISERASFYRDAALNPADSTVHVEKIDQGDVLFSAVAVAYPWKRPATPTCCGRGPQLWRLGFIANIDLAHFANEDLTVFNRSIEGGGGLAWRLADDFSLALTLERVVSRRLRNFVEDGKKLPVGKDTAPGSFTRDNDTYFRNDNLTAASFKFVYFLR